MRPSDKLLTWHQLLLLLAPLLRQAVHHARAPLRVHCHCLCQWAAHRPCTQDNPHQLWLWNPPHQQHHHAPPPAHAAARPLPPWLLVLLLRLSQLLLFLVSYATCERHARCLFLPAPGDAGGADSAAAAGPSAAAAAFVQPAAPPEQQLQQHCCASTAQSSPTQTYSKTAGTLAPLWSLWQRLLIRQQQQWLHRTAAPHSRSACTVMKLARGYPHRCIGDSPTEAGCCCPSCHVRPACLMHQHPLSRLLAVYLC